MTERKRGNKPGYWSFVVTLRLFGRDAAYGLLRMVAFYYWLCDAGLRRMTLPYLRRVFPDHSARQLAVDLYRVFYTQGISLIDRYRLMTDPAAFRNGVEGLDAMQPLLKDATRGFILLTSHVGNWQALMLALGRLDRHITLLMREEENAAVNEYLRIQEDAQRLGMVSPDLPMGGVIELTQRMQAGDIVAIMGDRSYGAATLPVEFLGAPAQFPCGPFRMASAWECPIVVMFSAKTGEDAYTVEIADIFQVEKGPGRSAEDALREAMQRYANRLADYARRYPYQVSLFQDVWKQ